MTNVRFIRSVLLAGFVVFPAVCVSCLERPKKRTETSGKETEQVEIPESALRPGTELKPGEIYRDTVTYFEYDDRGDYAQVFVGKDGAEVYMLTTSNGWEVNRGDLVALEWKMDSMWVAGDGDKLYVVEWAVDLKRIKKGPLTCWRRDYHRPLDFEYPEDFGDDYAQRCHEAVEWYLCHLTPEMDESLRMMMGYGKSPVAVTVLPWERSGDEDGEQGWPPVLVVMRAEYGVPTVGGEMEEMPGEWRLAIAFDCRNFVYYRYDEDKDEFTDPQTI